MLANVDVQRCLFIIFQHQPIYLPYTALSAEQFIRDFDWVLCKHRWEFPIYYKLIPKLTCQQFQLKIFLIAGWVRTRTSPTLTYQKTTRPSIRSWIKCTRSIRDSSPMVIQFHTWYYTQAFFFDLWRQKLFFTDFQCVGTENDFIWLWVVFPCPW